MPDSGISTFWIFFFSTCVILNYTGKQLVSRDLYPVKYRWENVLNLQESHQMSAQTIGQPGQKYVNHNDLVTI